MRLDHNAVFANLQRLACRGCLPHAILLVAEDINAADDLAKQFANWLLCTEKTAKLFAAATHPDFICIQPQVSGNTAVIKIDDIRTLVEFAPGKPQLADHKVALICAAQYLNEYSVNALLKTLEEPPANTIFILTTANQYLLLPTLLSRCTVVGLSVASPVFQQAAAAELPDATNAVVATETETATSTAVNLRQQLTKDLNILAIDGNANIIAIADQWRKLNPFEVLDNLWLSIADVIKAQIIRPIEQPAVNGIGDNSPQNLSAFWPMLDKILQAKAWLNHGKQLNMQLFLENIIITWRQVNNGKNQWQRLNYLLSK